MKSKIFIVLVCLSVSVYSQNNKFVGITESEFELSASTQRKSSWCWAASIKMILDYYGAVKPQTEIVERTFGRNYSGELPNRGGSMEDISFNLNLLDVDYRNHPYKVQSKYFNSAPSTSTIINELSNKRPILIAYQSGPNMGHAVVITGCRFTESDGLKKINTIIVRDPWPSKENLENKGVVSYSFAEFYDLIYSYWIVDLVSKGDVLGDKQDFANCNTQFCGNIKKAIDGFSDNFLSIRTETFGGSSKSFRTNLAFDFPDNSNYVYTGESPYFYLRIYKGQDENEANQWYTKLKEMVSGAVKISVNDWERESNSVGVGHQTTKEINLRLNNELIIKLSEVHNISPENEFIVNLIVKERKIKY